MVTTKPNDNHAKQGAKAPAAPPAGTPAKTGVPPLPAGSDLCANDKPQRARVTRAKVAELLGVSLTSVRRMEESGVLHPAVDPVTGERRFDLAEVERVAAERSGKEPTAASPSRSDGEVCADIFRLLEQGKPLPSIVVDLRVAPDMVERAADEWTRLKARDLHVPSVPGTLAKIIRNVNWLASEVKELRARCIEGCPLSGVHRVECRQCGASGYLSVAVKCTGCDRVFEYGRRPPEDEEDE